MHATGGCDSMCVSNCSDNFHPTVLHEKLGLIVSLNCVSSRSEHLNQIFAEVVAPMAASFPETSNPSNRQV